MRHSSSAKQIQRIASPQAQAVEPGAPKPRRARGRPADQVRFEAVLTAPTRSQQLIMDEALRLLATWAVRAARGPTEEPDST